MKVYARCKIIYDEYAGRVPYNQNIAIAVEGFHEMGFEIYFYDKVEEIYELYELGDIVLDGIYQVEYCLNKFRLHFPSIEYPDCLQKYLGRKIWKDTINHISMDSKLWGNFVKPVKEKIFTGKIINGTNDLIGCGSCYEDYEVYVSEPIDFVYEVRGTVYYDQLVDLRPYKGNWGYMNKIDTDIIILAMFPGFPQYTIIDGNHRVLEYFDYPAHKFKCLILNGTCILDYLEPNSRKLAEFLFKLENILFHIK
jgi:hypothetical protein